LDPLATGVLPIAIGEATKLAGRMLDAVKGYDFTVTWGTATASQDAEGAVTATSDVRPDAAAIAAVLPAFTGPIDQVPPAYSALKVDGKRAYALARAGETVELAVRHVTILKLTVVAMTADSATFSALVSKGTYIRSLARDIAVALGTVGHVTMLRRTRAGPFGIGQAITLDKFEALVQGAQLEQTLLPLMAGLDDIPALSVDPDQAAALRQGRKLTGHPAKPGTYLACLGPVPVALVEIDLSEVRVLRGFNL
jgi:tRNA pseudouridine55 synthase